MRKWGQGTIRRKGLIVYVRMVQTNLKYVSRCRDQRSGSEIWCQRFFNIFGNEVSTRAPRFELIMTWVWNSWGLGDSRESHVEAACLVWDTWIEGSLWPEHGFSDLVICWEIFTIKLIIINRIIDTLSGKWLKIIEIVTFSQIHI